MRVRAKDLPKPPRGQSVTIGREYIVLGISCGHYRIVDDDGDPVMFEAELFDVVDDTIPVSWIEEAAGTEEWRAYPPELMRPGFFEDYHDRKPEAVEQFHQFVQRLEAEHGVRLGWLPPDEAHRRVAAQIKAERQRDGEGPSA